MRTLVALGCVVALSIPVYGRSVRWQTIALTGMTAPDGSIYQNVGTARSGESGTIAFRATFADTDLSWNLLTHRDNTTSLVARVGRTAPGTTSAFETVTNFAVSRTGEVGFLATLDTNSFVDSGAWGSDTNGVTGLVAREGSTLPGIVISGNIDRILANGGRYAVTPSSSSSTGLAGIWAGPPGSMSPVMRVGDLAPGWGGGGRFNGLPSLGALTAGGNVMFAGSVLRPGDDVSFKGLWVGPLDSPQLIARDQTPAPGGGTYSSVGSGTVNDSGRIAYTASVNLGDVGLALFAGTPASVTRVARAGDIAPGTGVAFVTLQRPQINSSGDLAFFATINRPVFASQTSTSVWRTTPSGLVALAVQGEQAPGTTAGAVFSGLDGCVFNDHGQCAFEATLFGPGVNSSNNKGVWFTDWDDPSIIRLLVRTGDDIEVLPGVHKTVSFLDLGASGGEIEGGPSNLSNDGRLTVRMVFTDSTSGVLVVSIPAPSTAAAVLLAVAGLRRRRLTN